MPVTVVKTVKPSGGDYTSLAAWEAGEQADLVAADQIKQADCYAMTDTTAVSIAGWTLDAAHYLFVNVPAGQQHGGKRGTGYRSVTTVNAAVIRAQQDYIRFHGLAISGGTSGGGGLFINGTPQPTHIRVTDTIAYDSPGTGFLGGAGSGGVFNNCVAMNNGVDGFGLSTGQASPYSCENCVAVNNGGKGISGFGPSGSFDFQLKNCYAGGNVGADYSSPHAAPTIATSFSEDGSLGTPTAAYSTANFTNVTPGTEDLSLAAGSALIDAGTDLSTDPNWVDPGGFVDIIGTTRPQGAGWDVGAFEYVAAGGTTVVTGIASTAAIGLVATRQKTRATGQPIEGDAGLAAGRIKQRQTGLPAVTNTGRAAGRSKVRTSGIAAVLSTAMQAHTVKIRTAGFAVEVDQALANAGRLVIQTGIALTASVGLAAAVVKQRLTGQAVETDTAVTSRAAKLRVTGIATVATQALASTSRKIRTTAVAAETDIALAARLILGQFASLAVTVRTLARGSGTGLTNVAANGTGATSTARTSTGRTRSNLEGT